MIYNAPTWANNQAPAINAARLQALCDAVQADGIEIQTLQQQQANPYTFKGDVASTSDLPSSGNTINDTYYVTGVGALYTWTGSAWEQSSVSASDYAAELTQINNNIGTLSSLTTTDKTSLVNAVNEVDGDVGNLSSLTTTEKSSVVGSINETVSDIGDINAALATKAEIDGLYEDMTVGNAEQLVSTVMVEDQEPYIFRTAGGSADIGDREYDKLVGGTLAWNQLVQNGNFASGDGWAVIAGSENQTASYQNNTATVTCLTSNTSIGVQRLVSTIPTLAGHKFLFSVDVYPSKATAVRFGGSAGSFGISDVAVLANVWTKVTKIGAVASDIANTRFPIYVNANGELSENDTVQIQNVFAIDLTQMFGSAIADYVYGLEQATPGAGVAWFRKLFPKDYYAYDAGSLQSVQAASHDTVGFNAYDHSTGKAVLLGGNQYQITGAYTSLAYIDINGDNETITPDANGLFTPVSNGTLTVTGGDSTTTCVHLVWDGERNGEHEPYVKHSYALDDSLTLRGIPKLDTANNLYYDGDTYESDGTVMRRYGVLTFNGAASEIWSYTASLNRVIINVPLAIIPPTGSANLNFIATKIVANNTQADYNAYLNDAKNLSVFAPASITSATDWKTWLSSNPITMVYELATPTTETADPFQSPQVVDDFGTEEYVDAAVAAGTRDMAIPVGHDTLYSPNLRAKLEMAPNSPADGDGDYIVRQTSGQNEYALLTSNATISALTTRVPACPTDTDGMFVLKATVSSGSVTYAWVAET